MFFFSIQIPCSTIGWEIEIVCVLLGSCCFELQNHFSNTFLGKSIIYEIVLQFSNISPGNNIIKKKIFTCCTGYFGCILIIPLLADLCYVYNLWANLSGRLENNKN